MTTIRQAEQQASKLIDRFEARLLLAYCLGVNRTYLITHDRDELSEDVLTHYEDCVSIRLKGMPVPYICGHQEFYGRSFDVTPDVLIPRPDTETIIDFILQQYPKNQHATLIDLGTGSGCIAVTLALENPNLTVSATDISPKALAIAKQNAQKLGANVKFYEGSWFEAIPSSIHFDIIVSNPPYIHSEDEHLQSLQYEPIGALTDGANGLTHIAHIIKKAPKYLNPNGLLVFEHGWDQGNAVRALFESQSCWQAITTVKDLGGNERVTAARFCAP